MARTSAWARFSIAMALASATTAAAITLAGAYSPVTFGEVWLFTSMNFLALPLLLADFMQVDLWVWYVIALYWIGEIGVIVRFYPE